MTSSLAVTSTSIHSSLPSLPSLPCPYLYFIVSFLYLLFFHLSFRPISSLPVTSSRPFLLPSIPTVSLFSLLFFITSFLCPYLLLCPPSLLPPPLSISSVFLFLHKPFLYLPPAFIPSFFPSHAHTSLSPSLPPYCPLYRPSSSFLRPGTPPSPDDLQRK